MNEQIREHVKASGLDVYGLGLDREKWEATVERFAELIVRDCERALHPQLRDMISRGQAYELIKRHFGVEQ